VSGDPAAGSRFEVACPHCGRLFVGDLIDGPASRYRGFKCPHCKLFVPYERADELDAVDPTASA
jgi:endogenous inhibitor of DNA gyrase (YacG/DUF329 family)